MKFIRPFLIVEGKFWYKTISDLKDWVDSNSGKTFIFIDTETTGLEHPSKGEQLTQIGAIAATYDKSTMSFKEVSSFNEKIKLTPETKIRMNNPNSRVKWVLGFNRYGKSRGKYSDESDVIGRFYDWVESHGNVMLVIQNAQFDMKFLNLRSKLKFNKDILDTKDIIQLFYIPVIQKLSEEDTHYADLIKSIGTSSRDNGLISSSMSKIGPALGLDMTNYHDAIADCRITINMLESLYEFLFQHQDIDISGYQLDRIKTKK